MRSSLRFGAALILSLVLTSHALADEMSDLRGAVSTLSKQLEVLQKKLESLEKAKATETGDDALDAAIAKAQVSSAPLATVSNAPNRSSSLPFDIALMPVFTLGGSTASDSELLGLQGGAHDPIRDGFTLQQAELSIGGNVDPYFYLESNIVFREGEGVELEEAFFTTTALPWRLELEGGFFLTEFGLINPSHPHVWDWVDQPIMNTRMFGGEGMRGPGLRMARAIPLPWSSEIHLGMQDAGGSYMKSFLGGAHGHHGEDEDEHGHEEEGHEHHEEEEEHHDEGEEHIEEGDSIGRRPGLFKNRSGLRDFVYLARWDNYLDATDEIGVKFGLSSLFGANNTGSQTNTSIFGGDLLVRWQPKGSFRGYPYVKWQTEIAARRFEAPSLHEEDNDGETLKDWALYSQLLYGWQFGWAGGARFEYASGTGESVGGRGMDPLRDDRMRVSPMLVYKPTEFSRVRLQYNYDRADFLADKEAHAVWVGFDMVAGTHPSHKYGQ